MSDDIFIGVVAQEGSKDVLCSGLFKFDPIRGYTGKLLVPFEPQPGDNLFDLPPSLKRKALFCLIDGSNFGTIIWPDFRGGHQIKNFAARIVNLQIRQMLTGVHVDADKPEVKKIRLISPILAYLFSLSAFQTSIQTSPYKTTIESVEQQDTCFDFESGTLSFGATGTLSPDLLAPTAKTVAYLDIQFHQPETTISCLRIIKKLEYLFSLLIFDFMKFEKAYLTIPSSEADSDATKDEVFNLERARLNDKAKTELERHQITLHLKGIDFGVLLNKFLATFDSIEQTLNWDRIATTEERYLEDKYFYSVRMIESLLKRLKVAITRDESAQTKLTEVARLIAEKDGTEGLVKFLEKRVTPLFSQPSLGDMIQHLVQQYSDIRVIEIIDPKQIVRLRGKEAHGTKEGFSSTEHQFMAFAYDILLLLYRLVILEHCGFERSFLYSELRRSHRYALYFKESTLKDYRNALRS